MKAVKRHLLLLMAVSTLVIIGGCGGGGKGSLLPPSNPPSPTDANVLTRIVGPTEVESGGVANLELTTGDSVKDQILAEATAVSWSYQPTEPSITFKKLNDSRNWQVKFPQVNSEVVYTISFVAVNHQASIRFSGQTQIRVITSPSVEPPKVYLRYPADWPEDVRTVGNGTKLKIVGEAYPGSYPIAKLRVTDQGTILQEWPFNGGLFEVDLEKFGSPGRKWVRVEAVDSQGNVGSSELELIHDPARLDALAMEFLRKYACTWDGRVVRFGDREDGPFAKPVRVYLWPEVIPYHSIVEEACEFWTRYTGVQFQVIDVPTLPTQIPLPCIVILGELNKSTTAAAITKKLYDSAVALKVVEGDITLYQGWLTLTDELKSLVIAHELGHVLLPAPNGGVDGKGHTADGHLMDRNGGNGLLAPYHQLAFKILYSHSPGDSL